jgi:hypothetical protein
VREGHVDVVIELIDLLEVSAREDLRRRRIAVCKT